MIFRSGTWRWWLAGLVLVALPVYLLAGKRANTQFQRGFYCWRYDASYEDREFAKQMHAGKLYVKIMDLDWNEFLGAHPTAKIDAPYDYSSYKWMFDPENLHQLNGDTASSNGMEKNLTEASVGGVVPVIYFTQNLLNHLSKDDLRPLAKKIAKKAAQIAETFDEWQMDADWTEETRDIYFGLLKELKFLYPQVTLSATLRLYPFKYRKSMGVPPVDRVMLMVYHVESPKAFKEECTVYTPEGVSAYVKGQPPYPLPVDLALPTFDWNVHFVGEKFHGVVNEISIPDLLQIGMLKKRSERVFEFARDTVIQHSYFRKGDFLKSEQVTPESLEASVSLVKPFLAPNATIAIFDLNAHVLQPQKEALNHLFAAWD